MRGGVTLYATDEGNGHPYKIGEIASDSQNSQSGYALVDLAGKADSLIVEAPCDESAVQDFASISVNVAIPFDMSVKRLAIIMLGIAILSVWGGRACSFLLRPFKGGALVYVVLWAAAAIPLLISLLFFAFPYNAQVAVYDSFQNHEYFELAKALSQGNVALDLPVSPELASMKNPYDTAAREIGAVPYFWDYAYFEGSYYCYFGVLPCLLYYLPWYLATGGEFLNEWAVFISLLLLIAGSIALMSAIAKRWFPRISWGSYLFGYVVLLVGTWGVFRIRHANLYSVPIVTGLVCVFFALACWILSTKGKKIKTSQAALGTLFASLTLACRPQLFLVSIFGLLLFVEALKRGAGRGMKTLAVFVPLLAVAMLVGYYNYARFGSPFDFGANCNLTTNDMTHRGFSLVQSIESLYYYLVFPLSISSSLPYVNLGMPQSWSLGNMITQGLPGGILSMTPVLVVGAFVCSKSFVKNALVRCLGIVSMLVALVLIVFDGMGAGVLVRYFSDFGFFLALPVVLVQVALFSRCENTGRAERFTRVSMAALLALSVVLQFSYAAFSPVY
ncbi:MAG: hypothetical protein Q4B69_01095 [Slackia sp.]|nr:hypothetical protein [Slackia sp.]